MIVRYFFAILLVLASPLSAQQVVVRTGDHPTFTRIVLSIPAGTAWELSEQINGYRLEFESDVSIDASRFYERIQRDRISDIKLDTVADTLEFELACRCFAEAFAWRNDQIVIDIKDPGSPVNADAVAITPLDDDVKFAQLAFPDPPVPPVPVIEPETLPVVLPAISLEIVPEIKGPPARSASLIDPLGELLAQQERVGALEARISAGLGRALSQGLLDPSEDDATDQTADLEDLLADIESILIPGITTRTSVDNGMKPDVRSPDETDPLGRCYDDRFADVWTWANEDPFVHQIGQLRSEITGEFDRVDPGAVEALARVYVYFGFGREAINALSIDGVESQERRVLAEIARLIDGDPLNIAGFSQQMRCPGAISVWGFLAHGDGPQPVQPNIEEIAKSFRLLPEGLQKHLGPRLATKLVGIGQGDLAESILSVAVQSEDAPIEAAVAASEISEDQGDTAGATQQLADLVDDDPRLTPEVFLRYLDLQVSQGNSVTADDIALLQTMRFESQDVDLDERLYRAEVEALIQMDSVDSALVLLDDPTSPLASDETQAFAEAIYSNVVENAQDTTFLEFVFDDRVLASDATLQNAIATRLLALGFPDKAEGIVATQTVGSAMMERRYLRAEIAIAKEDFELARAHLAGVTSPRAQLLLSRTGIPPSADVIETLVPDDRLATDWQFSNWESLAESDDPLLRDVVARVQDVETFNAEDSTPLATGRELITNSAALRENMAELLDRYQVENSDLTN